MPVSWDICRNAKREIFSKHSRQLLFSEAIAQPKTMVAQTAPPGPTPSPADPSALEATDRILQEIASVGRHLEAMDLKITDLTLASSSIRADIAGFRETANALDQCLTAVEDQVAVLPDQEEELRFLRAKINDLEDRSRRDNVRFFGIPEQKEGSDIKAFLRSLLSDLFGIEFSPPPEFQRVPGNPARRPVHEEEEMGELLAPFQSLLKVEAACRGQSGGRSAQSTAHRARTRTALLRRLVSIGELLPGAAGISGGVSAFALITNAV
ncbi:hypothetical protein NDU88_001061 [Pleurodeles waltl]|uniref:Uncharacterized protein n=1 Tax=Pleurodeles waltl TaxID=8319 RepID=A0AAV7LBZ8_PLEWA|nr:hypothetical protein NDU88_001061 [Pleurodeles waltl]